METLYTNGDSFVFGMECLGANSKQLENKNHSFPAHLAKLLNCSRYINNAHNGATNEFIFRKTMLDLMSFEQQGHDLSKFFVLIGITSLQRTEVDAGFILSTLSPWDKENLINNDEFPQEIIDYNTIFLNPGCAFQFSKNLFSPKIFTKNITQFVGQYLWTEPVQLEAQEARIIALQQFFKYKKIKHLFVNTVCPLERTVHLDLTDPYFYKINSDSFYNFAFTNYPEERQIKNHFTPLPHKEYATILADYIKNNEV